MCPLLYFSPGKWAIFLAWILYDTTTLRLQYLNKVETWRANASGRECHCMCTTEILQPLQSLEAEIRGALVHNNISFGGSNVTVVYKTLWVNKQQESGIRNHTWSPLLKVTINIGHLINNWYHTISPGCGLRRLEKIILVIWLGTYNTCWLGFIDGGNAYVHSDWLQEVTLRLSWCCQLPIVAESCQESMVLATILPCQGEAHPYKDHAEHNALHIKLTKWSNRWRHAQSHNDWGYLFKSMSYYDWWHCGRNLLPVAIWNKPSYERKRWSIRWSKTLNR